MGKTIQYLIGCVVVLLLADCSSQELLAEATPEIPTSSPVVPTETNTPTVTVPTPTETFYILQTIFPTDTAAPPTPTVEVSTFIDNEMKIQISYPAEWQEISHGVFAGEDGGYLIVQKLDGYNSSDLAYGAIDYANRYYSEFNPSVYCVGFGVNGCSIVMVGPDLNGNEIEKIITVVPYQRSVESGSYFVYETPRKYFMLVDRSIVRDDSAFMSTATNQPASTPDPVYLSLSEGITLTEVVSSEFEYTDEYYDARILSHQYCGPDAYELDRMFTMTTEDDGRVWVYRGEDLVYYFAFWDLMGNTPWNFCTWEDNWMIEGNGFVVLNGELLNDQFDVDEVFGWHLLGAKPLFFAKKDGHIYVYYANVLLPVEYDGITHYLCCSAGTFNPRTTGDTTWFYGIRDGVRYMVTISVDAD